MKKTPPTLTLSLPTKYSETTNTAQNFVAPARILTKWKRMSAGSKPSAFGHSVDTDSVIGTPLKIVNIKYTKWKLPSTRKLEILYRTYTQKRLLTSELISSKYNLRFSKLVLSNKMWLILCSVLIIQRQKITAVL